MDKIKNYIITNDLDAEQAREYIDSIIHLLGDDDMHSLLLFYSLRYGFIPSQNNTNRRANAELDETIIDKLDVSHKGWTYDEELGYSFNGDVRVTDDIVEDGKLTIKFNKVGGDFDCSKNQLTSLEGFPKSVGGWLVCDDDEIFYVDVNTLCGAKGAIHK